MPIAVQRRRDVGRDRHQRQANMTGASPEQKLCAARPRIRQLPSVLPRLSATFLQRPENRRCSRKNSAPRKECVMTRTMRASMLALTAAFGLSLLPGTMVPAAAQTTKLKLVLNWKYQGPQGMFF